MAEENTELKEKEVVEEEVKITTKKAAKEVAAPSTKEKELQAQLDALQAQMQVMMAALGQKPIAPAAASTSDVTLVYMSDSDGVVHYGNGIELVCTRFGEEFVITRSAFDEIVGKYRKWFDNGTLAVSYKNIDVAAAKGVRTDKEYGLTSEKLNKLGKMSVSQIEALWNEVDTKAHHASIVTFFKKKFIENKEEGYRDRARIDCLNRLSNGGFNREVDELSGRTKYNPIDMGL